MGPPTNPELLAMADAQYSEQTESKPLNTELETPTLDAATEH
jgi:small subunit ribosomal protein S1